MATIVGTWGYTKLGSVYIPERQLRHICKGETAEALRGYAHILVVINQAGDCLGWITKSDAEKCKEKICNPKVF